MQDEGSTARNETSTSSIGRRDGLMVKVRSLVPLALWALLVFVMFRYFNAARFTILAALGAMALAATLQPVVNRLPGPCAVRAAVAVGGFLLLLAGLLAALGFSLYGPIAQSVEQWPRIRDSINRELESLARSVGANGELTVAELGEIGGELLTGGSVASWVTNVAGGALTALLATLVVIIAAMYLLASPDRSLVKPAVGILPVDRQEPTLQAMDELWPELRWWLIGTAFSMFVVGTVFGIGYVLIGLEFALPLAIFAAVAQSVPTFGPMVTLLLSLLIAATQGVVQFVGAVGVYLVVQSLESYLLTPMVMRQAVRIPPIITLFTIILWGNIFGVAGLILAIPLDLAVWVFLKHHVVLAHQSDSSDKSTRENDSD